MIEIPRVWDFSEEKEVFMTRQSFIKLKEDIENNNKMLEGAVEVIGARSVGGGLHFWTNHEQVNSDTHKAILINITEIEKKCPTCGAKVEND